MRLTIICPAAHIADANNLAQVLGYGPADGLTYGEPRLQGAPLSRQPRYRRSHAAGSGEVVGHGWVSFFVIETISASRRPDP